MEDLDIRFNLLSRQRDELAVQVSRALLDIAVLTAKLEKLTPVDPQEDDVS